MNAGHGWNEARRILCVRLDAIGDVLMTTPALRALHENLPERRITLLTSISGAKAAELVPWVDDVIVYDAPWLKATAHRSSPEADLAVIERLREARFDAAVVFTVYSQNPLPSAMLCYLAGIPLRLAHCRENPYQLLTHWEAEREPHAIVRHEVRRQLDLVASVGMRPSDERLSICIPEPAKHAVARRLARSGLDPERQWAVIHPGSTAPSRRYPAEGFGKVAECLVRDHGVQVVFTGAGEEGEEIEAIRRGMGGAHSVSLAGELNLPELAALLESAPLLISNNSGPVHVAAAVGTPVVDLYALTNPQHTPWAVPHRVLNYDVPCKYCYKSICPEGHHDCLRRVRPEDVVHAALELLAGAEVRGPASERERTLLTCPASSLPRAAS